MIEIIQQIGCGIAIIGYKEVNTPQPLDGRRGIARKSTTHQLFEMEGDTRLFRLST